jgi:glycosyltransferase involved in cell wall biosynthesis
VTLHLAYVVNGDPRSAATQSGVASHLGDALSRRPDMRTAPVDASLSGPVWWMCAARTAGLAPQVWRSGMTRRVWTSAFHRGMPAMNARTRRLERLLRAAERPVEAVLTLRTTYRPIELPYYSYIDNTLDVAHRYGTGGFRLTGRRFDRAIDAEGEWYRGAAHVFTTGRLVAESLTEAYGVPPERVSVVGAGSHFGPVTPEQTVAREPWILFVGYDFHRKGGDRLVAAFRDVRARVPGARLKIVGPAVEIADEGVDVLGPIRDRQELSGLFLRSSVYSLPVRWEPYGISLLEAMGHGLPCVATPVGAIPEIIEHETTGLIVPEDRSDALADALVTLLADPATARRMGEAGRDRVRDELNWDVVAGRIAETICAVASDGAR